MALSRPSHEVIFEARELTDLEKEKIQNYFKIKRRSGGGECGPVERVSEGIYKISFLEQEAQQRVLDKKEHVIAGCEKLCLSVTRNDTPGAKKDSTDNQQGATGGEQTKSLKMEHYLLTYLKENPKAGQVLHQKLSTLSSSFDILPETDELVVTKGPAQKELRHEKWEMQLEDVCSQIMQTYQCYYEVEPERLKILQENPLLRSENIYVYQESKDLAVVVGENSDVDKLWQKLEALQAKQQIRKDFIVSEAHFTLLEEEFGREMKASTPHVKIERQGSRTAVFQGPEAEVEVACDTLEQLVRKIRQRRLQLPAPLIAFLKSSGAIQTYQRRFQQSLRSPVMLEAGPDLILSSLTSESLEEAAVALERDLNVEEVVLERAEAESPGLTKLKETLDCALQRANQDAKRVELSYAMPSKSAPQMRVQIVGYKREIEQLKTILINYKHNQADVSDILSLPNSLVVDNFYKVLDLLGLQSTGLRLMPIPLPSPSVQCAGPRELVRQFRERLASGLDSLVFKDFIVDGPGALQYFRGEGKDNITLLEGSHHVLIVLLPDRNAADTAGSSMSALSLTPTDVQSHLSLTPPDYSKNKIDLEVLLGRLEDQQVDVMVAPMVGRNMTSMRIGAALAQKAGTRLQQNFDGSRKRQRALKPGDVLEVDGVPVMACQKILFIECLRWDALKGNSEKALRYGLKQALELCEHNTFSSVAFPIMGPGVVLGIPAKKAAQILSEEIGRFGQRGPTRHLSTIRIVLEPGYEESAEVFQEVCRGLNSYMVDNSTGQAVFQSLTSDLDDITVALGGNLKLQLVFGDITNESTDAIVNTTDFQHFDTSVCKDILTMAGPVVQRALQSAQVKRGEIFSSSPGSFPCKAILHVCGQRDAAVIQGLARDILLLCDRKQYQSVAIPAICAGTGDLNPRVVADAILKGVNAAMSSCAFHHLTSVRLILFKINVFQEFRAAARAITGSSVDDAPGPLRAPTSPLRQAPHQPLSPDLSLLLQPSSAVSPPAAFSLLGTSQEDLTNACSQLQRFYTSHCSQHVLPPQDLAGLSPREVGDLARRASILGVVVEPSGPGTAAGVVVRGPKEGVQEVMQGLLRQQLAEREQRELFSQVVWCIMGQRGGWERLPKEANQKLERGDVSGGVVDAHGCLWNVNLQQMTATAAHSGQTTSLKRLENLPDFRVPLYWDCLGSGTPLQVIQLSQSSAEFDQVKRDFKQTAKKTVLKIERVQNVHLRRAYEVLRQQLDDRNGPPVGAGEKMLYHGTTDQNCQAIMKNGFNRRFAGQNGTLYGLGTYFAVNAGYSANPTYSRPDTDGTQLMFVARVLTGHYTLGQRDMRVPPPVSDQQPHILFDSLVDNQQSPSMFVVFHDSQAYPDYLITFK